MINTVIRSPASLRESQLTVTSDARSKKFEKASWILRHANKPQGDFGSLITRIMSSLYPQHIKAHHINLIIASEPIWTEQNPKPEYRSARIAGLQQAGKFFKEGSGYSAIQGTKVRSMFWGEG